MNGFINPINVDAITMQNTLQIYSVVSDEGMGIFYNWEKVLDVMEKTCGISVTCHPDVFSAYTTACNEIVNRRIISGIYHTPPILPRLEGFGQEGNFFPCTDMIYTEDVRERLLKSQRVFVVFNCNYYSIVAEGVNEVGNHLYHSNGFLNIIECKSVEEAKNFLYVMLQRMYYPTSAYLEKTPVFTENIGITENLPAVNFMGAGQEIFKNHGYNTQVGSTRYAYSQLSKKSTSEEIQNLPPKNSSETLKSISPTASITDGEVIEREEK